MSLHIQSGIKKGTNFINKKTKNSKVVFKTKKFFRTLSHHLLRRSALEMLVREMTNSSDRPIKEDDLTKISSTPVEDAQNLINFIDKISLTYNLNKLHKIIQILSFLCLNYNPFKEKSNKEKIKKNYYKSFS